MGKPDFSYNARAYNLPGSIKSRVSLTNFFGKIVGATCVNGRFKFAGKALIVNKSGKKIGYEEGLDLNWKC